MCVGCVWVVSSQNQAALALLSLLSRLWWLKCCYDCLSLLSASVGRRVKAVYASYLVEYVLELVLRQRRALDVLDRTQIPRHSLSIFFPDGLHLLLGELFPYLWILSQVTLRANDQTWYARAMMVNLGKPLFPHVLERRGRCDGKANQENVCLRV